MLHLLQASVPLLGQLAGRSRQLPQVLGVESAAPGWRRWARRAERCGCLSSARQAHCPQTDRLVQLRSHPDPAEWRALGAWALPASRRGIPGPLAPAPADRRQCAAPRRREQGSSPAAAASWRSLSVSLLRASPAAGNPGRTGMPMIGCNALPPLPGRPGAGGAAAGSSRRQRRACTRAAAATAAAGGGRAGGWLVGGSPGGSAGGGQEPGAPHSRGAGAAGGSQAFRGA